MEYNSTVIGLLKNPKNALSLGFLVRVTGLEPARLPTRS